MSNTEQIPSGTTGVPHTLVERHTTIIRRIALTNLCEPLTPMRHNMDDGALQELMDGIRRSGLLQNLCVVPIMGGERVAIKDPTDRKLIEHENKGGTYRVAAGHRRLLACRAIFLDAVTCKVFCDPSTSEDEIMAGENTHREDPTDYDLAVMYSAWAQIPGITEKELEKRAGKSIGFIYTRMELLNGYKEVADALHERKISMAVAKTLNSIEDAAYMAMFLAMALDQGATSKRVAAWVAEYKARLVLTEVPALPAVVGISVTQTLQPKIECLLCGDPQSYNLRTVMLCVTDVDRIKEARAAREAQEAEETPQP